MIPRASAARQNSAIGADRTRTAPRAASARSRTAWILSSGVSTRSAAHGVAPPDRSSLQGIEVDDSRQGRLVRAVRCAGGQGYRASTAKRNRRSIRLIQGARPTEDTARDKNNLIYRSRQATVMSESNLRGKRRDRPAKKTTVRAPV